MALWVACTLIPMDLQDHSTSMHIDRFGPVAASVALLQLGRNGAIMAGVLVAVIREGLGLFV